MTSKNLTAGFSSVIAMLVGSGVYSSEFQTDIRIDFGARVYTDDGTYAGQSERGPYPFIGGELSAFGSLGPGEFVFEASGLFDDDGGRSAVVLEKAYYTQSFSNFDLVAGFNVENWGVADSQTIVNVINPQNGKASATEQDFMGTPMINANFGVGGGTLSLYALTGFIDPIEADDATRERFPISQNDGEAIYEEGNARNLDFAIRYANTVSLGQGSLDYALSGFTGTSRTPTYIPNCTGDFDAVPALEATCDTINTAVVDQFESGAFDISISDFGSDAFATAVEILELITDALADVGIDITDAITDGAVFGFSPYYQKIDQLGFETQYTINDLQLRLEAIYRDTSAGDFTAAVIGGSYSFNDWVAPGSTLTATVEYLWDDRSLSQPTNIFADDLFLGLDLQMNNAKSVYYQLGMFYDLEYEGTYVTASLGARLTDSTAMEFSLATAHSDDARDGLFYINDDTFFEFKFSRFF